MGKEKISKWRKWQYILAFGYMIFVGLFVLLAFIYKGDLPTIAYVGEFIIFLVVALLYTIFGEKDKEDKNTNRANNVG